MQIFVTFKDLSIRFSNQKIGNNLGGCWGFVYTSEYKLFQDSVNMVSQSIP